MSNGWKLELLSGEDDDGTPTLFLNYWSIYGDDTLFEIKEGNAYRRKGDLLQQIDLPKEIENLANKLKDGE